MTTTLSLWLVCRVAHLDGGSWESKEYACGALIALMRQPDAGACQARLLPGVLRSWSGALLFIPASGQTPASPPPTATIFGVGDIMHCAAPQGAELTGRLMERLLNETPNSIGITLGDNSNDNGTEADYHCFDRSSWGRMMARLRPTPGNHDYGVDKLLPFYYLYFPNAGPPRLGYSAYDFGGWRIYSLNSELVSPELRQQQLSWLEQDLHTHSKKRCTLAYFHRPPFSSGDFASPAWVMPIFRNCTGTVSTWWPPDMNTSSRPCRLWIPLARSTNPTGYRS